MTRYIPGGLFIAIEGIDGTGKSSLCQRLKSTIELKSGYSPLVCHEPGSPNLEHLIRGFFKRQEGPLEAESMAVLFTADRLIHMDSKVRPALKNDQLVITDRHKLSTMVYQTARGCSEDVLKVLNSVPSPEPNLTILLTVDPEKARERMIARNPDLDSYERDIAIQHKMQGLYLAHLPDPSYVIDTNDRSIDDISEQATARIVKMISERIYR